MFISLPCLTSAAALWVTLTTWLAFYLNVIVSLSLYFSLLGSGFFWSWVLHWFIFASSKGPAHTRYPALSQAQGLCKSWFPGPARILRQLLQHANALSQPASHVPREKQRCLLVLLHAHFPKPSPAPGRDWWLSSIEGEAGIPVTAGVR